MIPIQRSGILTCTVIDTVKHACDIKQLYSVDVSLTKKKHLFLNLYSTYHNFLHKHVQESNVDGTILKQ